jgi:hypothetical protein
VPGPSVDLLALLRPSSVTVTVTGIEFTLEATVASHWLGAIAVDRENLAGVMPGLIDEDDLETMCELMRDVADIQTRWQWAARTALGRAAGRDWWWALNLCRRALDTWMHTNGILLRQHVDAKAMNLSDWLDACYTLYWQNGDEEARMKLDLELGMRPKGLSVRESPGHTRAMMADFAAD